MREMPCALDGLEARSGNGCAISAPISFGQNAIARAQKEQGGNPDRMQAALELRVVREWGPAVSRGGFAIARRRQHVGLWHRLVIALRKARIEVGKLREFDVADGEEVDDVTGLAI